MGLQMPQGSPPSRTMSTTNNTESPTQLSSEHNIGQPHICITGAGIAGLTTALALATRGFTNISVYEYASNLGFVGAGIQLAPNMARVLSRLDVWKPIERDAVVLHDTSIREGASDRELANVKLDYIKDDYGFHHMVGHRHSLANGLYEGCLRYPDSITFHFSTTVSDIGCSDLDSVSATGQKSGSRPSFLVTPRDQSQNPYNVQADVLFGCDGIKSQTRTALLSSLNIPTDTNEENGVTIKDTNQAAYRIMIPRDLMLSSSNPALHELIDCPRATRWIAAKKHIIAYPIQNNTIYNLSTVQPDTNFSAAPSATYTTKGSKVAMLKVFEDFCPTVKDMLNLVPEGEVCEWKLRVHSPLPTWVGNLQQKESGWGRIALVGDACHPTLPHLAQGAAQAIEDAAVIGTCLDKLRRAGDWSSQSVHKALKVYEKVRKGRAEMLVETAAASGKALHLADGEDKIERDRMFAGLRSNQTELQQSAGRGGQVPDKWADREVQKTIYGVDCEKDVEENWEQLFASVDVA